MNYLAPLFAFVKAILPTLGHAPQAAIERAVTIPKKEREKLYAGMSPDEKSKAEQLARIMFDAIADWVGFVASRGMVEPD